MLSSGLPRRHHAILYLYVKLVSPYTSEYLQKLFKPDPEEVGACVWLDRHTVEAVVASADEDPEKCIDMKKLSKTFK